MICPRCESSDPGATLFCQHCGKLLDRAALEHVRLMGPVGVQHSTSPKIEQFWQTGDPAVFGQP
jgi:hypothetical protein